MYKKGVSIMVMEKRSVVTAVILGFLTCSIYLWVWSYKQWDELYRANGYRSTAGTDILLSFITCGIYYIYMNYKMGKLEAEAYHRYGLGHKDDSILYLILAIFGLSLVNQCLVQSNKNNQLADVVNHAHYNNHMNMHGGGHPPFGGGHPPHPPQPPNNNQQPPQSW